MGVAKDIMFEEMEKEERRMKGRCWSCGKKLSREERETERDECFDCYCERQ